MKENNESFDYRLKYDDKTNRPIGVVWMTGTMKQNWKVYGDTVFLDMQKKEFNKLGWPYFGPTMLDCESRIVQGAEAIVLEESNDMYAWVLKSMEEMEPSRKLNSVQMMFGDCVIHDSLLELLGISEICCVGWDVYHLIHQIWPNAPMLSRHYHQIKSSLEGIVYAKSQEEFNACYKNIETILSPHPQALDYMNEFLNNQEKFAYFHLKQKKRKSW